MIGQGRSVTYGAALGRFGQFTHVGGGQYGLVSREGRRRALDMIPISLQGEVDGWFDEDDGVLVLGSKYAEYVLVIDLDLDELRSTVELRREADVGIRHQMFLALRDNLLGFVYEGGMVAFDGDGRATWHQNWVNPSITMRSVDGAVVWLEKQWPPDQEGDTIGIRISDGNYV
jgi:hypothetical protein